MNDNFFDGLDELYRRAKFGEHRTMRAGCRCENVVFITIFSVCHAPSPEHRALEGCIVRTSIALPFIGRFRRGLQCFFYRRLLFQIRYIVRALVARWGHKSREIAVKNSEKSKNRRKSLCAPLRIAERFKENSNAVVWSENVDVHLYIFFRMSILNNSADSKYQILYG